MRQNRSSIHKKLKFKVEIRLVLEYYTLVPKESEAAITSGYASYYRTTVFRDYDLSRSDINHKEWLRAHSLLTNYINFRFVPLFSHFASLPFYISHINRFRTMGLLS